MKKAFLFTIPFLLIGQVNGRTINPKEVEIFTKNVYHLQYETLSVSDKNRINQEYNDRSKLVEKVANILQSDPEYLVLSDSYILDYWSRKIANDINPSDEELKQMYSQMKGIKTPARFDIRHIILKDETEADDLIAQLKKKEDSKDRLDKFVFLAEKYSLDTQTKSKGGQIGWIESNRVSPLVRGALQSHSKGDVIKLGSNKEGWEIVLINDQDLGHEPTFEELKPALVTKMKKDAIESRIKKLMVSTPSPSTSSMPTYNSAVMKPAIAKPVIKPMVPVVKPATAAFPVK